MTSRRIIRFIPHLYAFAQKAASRSPETSRFPVSYERLRGLQWNQNRLKKIQTGWAVDQRWSRRARVNSVRCLRFFPEWNFQFVQERIIAFIKFKFSLTGNCEINMLAVLWIGFFISWIRKLLEVFTSSLCRVLSGFHNLLFFVKSCTRQQCMFLHNVTEAVQLQPSLQ